MVLFTIFTREKQKNNNAKDGRITIIFEDHYGLISCWDAFISSCVIIQPGLIEDYMYEMTLGEGSQA